MEKVLSANQPYSKESQDVFPFGDCLDTIILALLSVHIYL